MRPLIFDMFFNDDRKFVMEISKVAINGEQKWAIITRRNVSDYPPIRTDSFDTRESALKCYFEIVLQTPLACLGSKSPDPPISLEEYKTWLKSKRLTDKYLDIN